MKPNPALVLGYYFKVFMTLVPAPPAVVRVLRSLVGALSTLVGAVVNATKYLGSTRFCSASRV